MEAEDGRAAGTERFRTAQADQGAGMDAGPASDPAADRAQRLETTSVAQAAPEPGSALDPDTAAPDEEREPGREPESESEPDAEPDPGLPEQVGQVEEAERAGRAGRPVSSGIGCAALLLPLVAVLGAILCFAAGILSTVTGCTPNGSALCSANGAWFEFALPLFVSPIVAAAAAIGAVTVRRHRSTWLAVGYGIVFISIIVGLASASTGSN